MPNALKEIVKPACHRCGQVQPVLIRYNITASGVRQYFWYCTRCERITPQGTFVQHSTIEPHIEALPVDQQLQFYADRILNDYSINCICEICGAIGTELHHFAPQSLAEHFGNNWTKWPTINLCKPCHDLWHAAVTPYMPHVQKTDIAQKVLEKYYEVHGI